MKQYMAGSRINAVVLIAILAVFSMVSWVAVTNTLYEPLHLLAELFTVFVSLSIFSMTWYSYDKSKNDHALFLGAVFLVIGLIEIHGSRIWAQSKYGEGTTFTFTLPIKAQGMISK